MESMHVAALTIFLRLSLQEEHIWPVSFFLWHATGRNGVGQMDKPDYKYIQIKFTLLLVMLCFRTNECNSSLCNKTQFIT
jgi:hypothetical protein